MDDPMRILKAFQSHFRRAIRQSLELFGLEPKRSNSDIVGMYMYIVRGVRVGATGGGGGGATNHTCEKNTLKDKKKLF